MIILTSDKAEAIQNRIDFIWDMGHPTDYKGKEAKLAECIAVISAIEAILETSQSKSPDESGQC